MGEFREIAVRCRDEALRAGDDSDGGEFASNDDRVFSEHPSCDINREIHAKFIDILFISSRYLSQRYDFVDL